MSFVAEEFLGGVPVDGKEPGSWCAGRVVPKAGSVDWLLRWGTGDCILVAASPWTTSTTLVRVSCIAATTAMRSATVGTTAVAVGPSVRRTSSTSLPTTGSTAS